MQCESQLLSFPTLPSLPLEGGASAKSSEGGATCEAAGRRDYEREGGSRIRATDRVGVEKFAVGFAIGAMPQSLRDFR